MKFSVVLTIVALTLLFSACTSVRQNAPENAMTPNVNYDVPPVVAAKLVKQKKVKMKYARIKGYARATRSNRKKG